MLYSIHRNEVDTMSRIFLSAKIPTVGTKLLDAAHIDYEVFENKGVISKEDRKSVV